MGELEQLVYEACALLTVDGLQRVTDNYFFSLFPVLEKVHISIDCDETAATAWNRQFTAYFSDFGMRVPNTAPPVGNICNLI